MSFALLSAIVPNGSDPSIDLLRLSLEGTSAHWFRWVLIWGFMVAIGCVMEVPETVVIIKHWYARRFKHEEPAEDTSWRIPVSAVGLLLVIAGVAGETICESLVSTAETNLRTHESRILSDAESKAANAVQKAAIVGNETEGLKAEAASAKRDMVVAQLELARLTGPVHIVPVVNGVARPDLSKGLIQEISLTRDVRVMAPILPDIGKDGTAPWTLFLDQDSVGSHQYTFEFMRDVKAYPGLVPNSRASFEFITDAHGRSTIRGIPLVDMPNTTTKPSKK